MKRISVLLAVLAAGWGNAQAEPGLTNPASASRILVIDSSSMHLAVGKVTLTIGVLQRAHGVYSGDYKIKVSPCFFKNEKGRLAIIVSDESQARLDDGKVVAIIGTATTNGKGGRRRHIDAIATPANRNRGKLKLWFMAGAGKMVFTPAYHLAEKETEAVPAQTTGTNLASRAESRLAASHRKAFTTAANLP
jgi:hypothetical protein